MLRGAVDDCISSASEFAESALPLPRTFAVFRSRTHLAFWHIRRLARLTAGEQLNTRTGGRTLRQPGALTMGPLARPLMVTVMLMPL